MLYLEPSVVAGVMLLVTGVGVDDVLPEAEWPTLVFFMGPFVMVAGLVAIGIAQRAGHPISFWTFTGHGIVVTLLSSALAWVYVWLRYF